MLLRGLCHGHLVLLMGLTRGYFLGLALTTATYVTMTSGNSSRRSREKAHVKRQECKSFEL